MNDLFSKPIDAITAADIADLIEHGPAEGSTVEYKAALSEDRDEPDPWGAGEPRIGGRARDRIVKELVAFANAGGGTLVLGVAETRDDPPRPSEIRPLPRCAALDTHLTDVLKSAIDPALPLIHIVSVPILGDAGVVVIRVPASRRAPHRCANTRHIYKRFHHQSTPIGMSEIHELVLHPRSGLERLEQSLADRRQRFAAEWGGAFPHSSKRGYAFAVTVAPIEPMALDRLGPHVPMGPALHDVSATLIAGQRSVPAYLRSDVVLGRSRPIVRGVRLEGSPDPWARAEIHQSGLIDVWVRIDERPLPDSQQTALLVVPRIVLAILINALSAGHRLRRRAGQPEAELAVSIAFHAPQSQSVLPVLMAGWHQAPFALNEPWVEIDRLPELPRYYFGAVTDLPDLVRAVHRDLMDASGRSYDWDLHVDASHLAGLMGIGAGS